MVGVGGVVSTCLAAEGNAAEWVVCGGVFSAGLERSGDGGVWGVWQRCENVARAQNAVDDR